MLCEDIQVGMGGQEDGDICIHIADSGFPGGLVVKNLPANAGDMGSIPGMRRSPGRGNGNPFQYSCLGNLTDRGARRATVRGMAKNQTRLSD